jgi:hypothetical protein
MSLNEKLSRRKAANRKLVPPDKLTIMDRAQDQLAKSGITDTCLREGDQAPKFRLPNAVGQIVSLDVLLRQGPVVLSFYRGGW